MNLQFKIYLYLVLVCSMITACYVEAKNVHKVACGNGKTIKVSDSQINRVAEACLRAGHPAPKKGFSPTMQAFSQMPQQLDSDDDCKYDPNDARLPDCKKKLKRKDGCKYDPDSAKLPCSDNKRSSLLLPAVQAFASVNNVANCGSDSSISKALDQCGKKGFKSALCKKKNGNWSCSPSDDKTNPNVRSTDFMNR